MVWEAGWASKLVWIQRLEGNSFASAEGRTPVVQSAVRLYTDWAIPAPVTLYSVELTSTEPTRVHTTPEVLQSSGPTVKSFLKLVSVKSLQDCDLQQTYGSIKKAKAVPLHAMKALGGEEV
jgi:hypothetical protein